MTTFRTTLYDFFFASQSPIDLGLGRLIFLSIIFLLYAGQAFPNFGAVPPEFWEPIALFKYLPIPVLDGPVLKIVWYAFLVGLLFSAIGLFTRPALLVTLVSGAYVLGFSNSVVTAQHFESLMLLAIAALAFSHCGDAYSVDSLLFRNRGDLISKRQYLGEYRWPIRTIWVLFTLAMCAAGISKLRTSGLGWISEEYLSSLIVTYSFIGNRGTPLSPELSLWVANKPALMYFMAIGTLLLETFAPLALFFKRIRWVIVLGLLAMQSGIWAFMGIPFPQMMAVYLFWVPWSRLLKKDQPS